MAITTKFNMTRDINGYNGFGVKPSTAIQGVALAQNVAQSFTTPSDAQQYIVILTSTPGSNVFADFTTTATAYSGTVGAVTSELNPVGRQVPAGQTISVLTPDTGGAYVEAAFYVINDYTN